MKGIAELGGYNSEGEVVYQEAISIHDYYDGLHPWDDSEQILMLGLTRVHGKLHKSDGAIFQEFETAFSNDDGNYIGSKTTHEDGSTNTDGIYANQSH